MLRRLDLVNFKAFEQYRIDFRGDAFLVGPNNAGKSTILAALRAGAFMIRIASRLRADDRATVDSISRPIWRFSGDAVRLVDENLRHEFRPAESRLTMHFESGAVLQAVWPEDPEVASPAGFFSVRRNDVGISRPSEVREYLPAIGVVPVLAPVDNQERLLSPDHVQSNLDGRLASRHLRNQLKQLADEDSQHDSFSNRLAEFRAFARPWLPELELKGLELSYGEPASVDLYYIEPGSRTEKEIFWAGDGMQIWLQILLHVFRHRSRAVILLDEPDVFLHADLQRRLVDLLESLSAQTITATHSSEVLAEAAESSVIWVSKDRKRAVRSPRPDVLYELTATLGTAFNLRVARALKARAVLFVEGQDARLLRELGKRLGLDRLATDGSLTVITLQGFTHWDLVEPFQWLMQELLGGAVQGYVVLDRDFRTEEEIETIEQRLRSIGLGAHVWRRKEIENYLLQPEALSRLSGAPREWIDHQLGACVQDLYDDVHAQIAFEAEQQLQGQGLAPPTLRKRGKAAADARLEDEATRDHACGGKQLLSALNGRLQDAGYKAVTDRRLARNLRRVEIPEEMREVLSAVERL